jgi:hypothetical protein
MLGTVAAGEPVDPDAARERAALPAGRISR